MPLNTYRFSIEKSGDVLRLVLFDSNSELACRKVKRSDLMKEISKVDTLLFKGRLQLLIEKTRVHILLKKQSALILNKDKFLELFTSTIGIQTNARD
jgi:hypothetical protein